MPPVVLLVPLYLTVVDVPIVALSLIDCYWAVWLPAGASAFNVIIMKRFFDNLPREIFEAARIDGAGPVPAVLVDRAADVEADPRRRLGVRGHRDAGRTTCGRCWSSATRTSSRSRSACPILQPTTELDVFLAALTISSLIPIAIFLVFQRLFLRGSGLERRDQGLTLRR